jgi:hypothetical protein
MILVVGAELAYFLEKDQWPDKAETEKIKRIFQ